MKAIVIGMALAVGAVSPAMAQCAFGSHKMAMSTPEKAVQMSVRVEEKKSFDVASMPVDGWLVRHLQNPTS